VPCRRDRAGCQGAPGAHRRSATVNAPSLSSGGWPRPYRQLSVQLDRLGRSLPYHTDTVTTLEKRGVGFRSITEAIDTTTPGGRLVFHLFGALGQFERDLIQERTRAGLAAAAERGRKGGRKPVVTGEKLERARLSASSGRLPNRYSPRLPERRSVTVAFQGSRHTPTYKSNPEQGWGHGHGQENPRGYYQPDFTRRWPLDRGSSSTHQGPTVTNPRIRA
jgi:hypothetical protein